MKFMAFSDSSQNSVRFQKMCIQFKISRFIIEEDQLLQAPKRELSLSDFDPSATQICGILRCLASSYGHLRHAIFD